jgi:uridine kinase
MTRLPGEALGVLGRSALLQGLGAGSLELLSAHLTQVEAAAGEALVTEGQVERALYFVLSGAAEVLRGRLVVQRLPPGAQFGGLGLLTGYPRAATVRAASPLVLARLDEAGWLELKAAHPALALRLTEAIVGQLREDLVQVTTAASALTQGRWLPRAGEVQVRLESGSRQVETGTLVRELLPTSVNGSPTVAALMGFKPVSLMTPVLTDTTLAPLSLSHWEGRQIFARSTALMLLEAAWELDPALELHLGPSRGIHQLVEVPAVAAPGLGSLAQALSVKLEELAAHALPIRLEQWLVDEARAHFTARGWDDAALLLATQRSATVPLASLGNVYALALGPLVPNTQMLAGATVRVHGDALAIELGALDPRRRGVAVQVRLDPEMVVEHRRWTRAMGITSVGAFNERCIDGEVTQLIRVAEGFHEKQISHIADAIAAARSRLRVISIAGPSSSGKTTFIKRLSVQLRINGLTPVALSLDDYYVNRVDTPRDATGEWDFEALEALRLELLHDHVRRLLGGEAVKLARYDFKSGLSSASGGQTLQLEPGHLLLLEGIHGLNPGLLGEIPTPEQRFRIFIHPATSLPFDRLSRVSTTDLRLLRRIVRDRHTRGYSAAENIARWPSVQAGEQQHIFPWQDQADATFDSSLVYEPAVLKVFAERYLLEVPKSHPSYATAWRLRHLVDRFIAIYPDHVPPTSIMREFIGGSGFEY